MEQIFRVECKMCGQMILFNEKGKLIVGDRVLDEKVLEFEYKNRKRYIICPECVAIIRYITNE